MANKTVTLETAIEAVRKLPADAQVAIAHEMIEHADAINNSQLTDDQWAVVKDRLNKPRKLVSVEDFRALLDQYKVT